MSTWQGWQHDLLHEAGLPTSADNLTFIGDWGDSEKTTCRNNPVVISRPESTSTNCKKLTDTRTAQNYPSQLLARLAFNQQIHSGNFPHLLAALADGTPYQVPNQHDVIADLIEWGAATFAFELQQNYGPPTPSGGGGDDGGIKAPRLHHGWAQMRVSVNQHMPHALSASERTRKAALRSLQRARKVRL